MTEFKVGDKIITNPEWDKNYRNSPWWNDWKNKVMTIRKIIVTNDTTTIEVHENYLWWDIEWMLKVESDFIGESEFKL
jgi:hypothetical protein